MINRRISAKYLLVCLCSAMGIPMISANADEDLCLQAIISSPGHCEVLVMREKGKNVLWNLVLPPKLKARGGGSRPEDPYQGKVSIDMPVLKDTFEDIFESQHNDRSEDNTHPTRISVILLLKSDDSYRITSPLNMKQCRELIRKDLLSLVLENLNRNRALLKPHNTLDLFYPDGARSEVESLEPPTHIRESPTGD
ncbi:hypothetical protein [Aeoliella sp.]|uniref:hypothetical protein n=1 Tax=Aeoliella sp. TaxID=2795800 RepID=UPI003CCBCD4E